MNNFKEKKGLFGPKKQAGAELKKKKGFFGPKFGKKLSIRAKMDQFSNKKEKKRLFGPKKTSWG